MPLSESVYYVAIAFKITERVKQRICIKFCIKLERSSEETTGMIQKATALGNVSGSFITTMWLLMHHSSSRVLGETSNYPGDSVSLQPRLSVLQLLVFPKTKITFEREESSDIHEIQKNMAG